MCYFSLINFDTRYSSLIIFAAPKLRVSLSLSKRAFFALPSLTIFDTVYL